MPDSQFVADTTTEGDQKVNVKPAILDKIISRLSTTEVNISDLPGKIQLEIPTIL